MLSVRQVEGVKTLLRKRKIVLAFDMGLGKTLTALVAAKALHAVKRTRTVVLCPSSLKANWHREAKLVGLEARLSIHPSISLLCSPPVLVG